MNRCHDIPAMTGSEVIIKGELHNSVYDLEDAKNILEDGVDCLVLEYPEEESTFSIRYFWFDLLMWLLNRIFFNPLYTDVTPLEEIAHTQDAEIRKTRKADVEIIQNASLIEEGFAFLVFLVATTISLFIGFFLDGGLIVGGLLFTFGVMTPPLLLREFESRREHQNRDEFIANEIEDATVNGGRIVAVVGGSHKSDVIDHLPDWIEPEDHDPVYNWYHPRMLARVVLAFVLPICLYGLIYLILIGMLRLLVLVF